jgi:hypothetical protein
MEGTYAKANMVDVFTRALGLQVRDRVIAYVIFLILIFLFFVDVGLNRELIIVLIVSYMCYQIYKFYLLFGLEKRTVTRMYNIDKWKRYRKEALVSYIIIGLLLFVSQYLELERFTFVKLNTVSPLVIFPIFILNMIKIYRFDDYFILPEGIFDTCINHLEKWSNFENVRFKETDTSLLLDCYKQNKRIYTLKLDDKTLSNIDDVNTVLKNNGFVV